MPFEVIVPEESTGTLLHPRHHVCRTVRRDNAHPLRNLK